MIVKKVSILDGKEYSMDLDVDPILLAGYLSNRDNRLIQNIFPNLTIGEREFIKSGITPLKWDKKFGKHP